MKKQLLALAIMLGGVSVFGQSPRITLYEEFTGETCPPCASTNPGLNAKLLSALNATRVIAIKWQVPIPSAPSNTWSLYQTNKAEIDWRYRSTAAGGYGYPSQSTSSSPITSGVNSAPSGRFDGQHQWVFGATSDHPTYVSDQVILNAKNVPSPFTINLTRDWNTDGTAINLTVTIQASMNFTTAGPLVMRTVMVERLIQFSVQPGTNGEKTFEDVAIKSYPNIQNGTPLPSTWTSGQSQTFTMSCLFPNSVRKKSEAAMVVFIQDDSDRKIYQAARTGKETPPFDVMSISTTAEPTCNNLITPVFTVQNVGANPVTQMNIVPYVDGVAGTMQTWSGNLAVGATTVINLTPVQTTSVNGTHVFSVAVTSLGGGPDYDMRNNGTKVNFLVASLFDANPIVQDFSLNTFPPANWLVVNNDNGPGWTRSIAAGKYQQTPLHSAMYNFYANPVKGDVDEIILPPLNLQGTADPVMSFYYAYAQRSPASDDRFEVLISADCGQNWTKAFDKSGLNLATFTPMSGPYIPGDFSHWVQEPGIVLTGFNKSEVLVKLRTTNDNGNNLYLDDININQPEPTGISKATLYSGVSANLYPNPNSGLSSLQIRSGKTTMATISVYNALGQVISSKSLRIQAGDNHLPVDLRDFAGGVYSLVIDTDNGSITKKVTVTK